MQYQSHLFKSRGYITTYNMFGKLIVFCTLAAVALSREYPAGLHPAVCPNYPYCEPDAFAKHTPSGIPIPQWGLDTAYYAPASADHAAFPAAARYPADFNPALCPNYPYCW